MEKRGQAVVIAVIIIAIIVLTVVIGWKTWDALSNKGTNQTSNETSQITNQSSQTTNQTTSTNQTTEQATNQTSNETRPDIIPNPSGTIERIISRNDGGGYFCNYSIEPEHKVRVYTYRTIDKQRQLSEEYIESGQEIDVCDNFDDINKSHPGMNYDLIWRWELVEGVDGYRVYQYYEYNTTKRDFNYYTEISGDVNNFRDSGLDSWILER